MITCIMKEKILRPAEKRRMRVPSKYYYCAYSAKKDFSNSGDGKPKIYILFFEIERLFGQECSMHILIVQWKHI